MPAHELGAVDVPAADPSVYVPPTHVEAKLSVSTAVTLAASIALALLNAFQANSTLLAGLQPWAQFMLIAALPPITSFLSGYATTSNRI